MIASQSLATTMLDAGFAQYNGGSLLVYEGEYAISPEFGESAGSTLLATFTFANPAFPSSPTFVNGFGMMAQASFTAASVTAAASGTACYAIAQASNGTRLEQRTAGMAWEPGLAVIQYQFIFSNGNTYICMVGGTTAASGTGPSGLGSVIADGTAQWKWFAAGAPDIQVTEAELTSGAAFSMPQFWLALPCL